LASAGIGTVIKNGSVSVGDMVAGSAVTTVDTIVLQHDRRYLFDRAALKFEIQSAGPLSLPIGTEKAEAVLLPNVKLFTLEESEKVKTVTGSSIVLNGSMLLPIGTVFIANGVAYKVLSTNFDGVDTVINFENPSIEDVFSRVEIRGNYEVTSDLLVSDTDQTVKPSVLAQAAQSGNSIEDFLKINSLLLSGTSKTSGTIAVSIVIVFDKDLGGLQTARLVATAHLENNLNLAIKGSASLDNYPIFSKKFSIPINLKVFDAALNLLNLHIAEISVPVGVVINGSASFDASTTISTKVGGTVTSIIERKQSTTTFEPTGSVIVSPPSVTTTSTAFARINAGVYFYASPALALLNSVVLLGVDVRVGPRAVFTALFSSDSVPPCVDYAGFVHGEAKFFAKTGLFGWESDARKTDVQVFENPEGPCMVNTTVTIGSARPVGPIDLGFVYGAILDVEFKVSPTAGNIIADNPPTGKVSLTSGDKEGCVADVPANGLGHCILRVGSTGANQPFEAFYYGDDLYEQSHSVAYFNIDKQQAFATFTDNLPAFVPVGSMVAFHVSVYSHLQGPMLPTGKVIVFTSDNEFLCDAILDSYGLAACVGRFVSIGGKTVLINYGGDNNYLPDKSFNGVPISVFKPEPPAP
jgi:hypothetical protein